MAQRVTAITQEQFDQIHALAAGGLTQRQIASKTGLSQPHVSRVLTGKLKPPPSSREEVQTAERRLASSATEEDLARVLSLTEAGHSQREIARVTGLTQSMVHRMQHGDWSAENRVRLSRLGLAPGELTGQLVARTPLGEAITDAMEENGLTADELTVLTRASDPFRADTPGGHRDGKWLADTAGRLGLGTRQIHLRGLHYMVLGQPKPDGTPYVTEDWAWFARDAGKAARWLGYIPWEQIDDHRNDEPVTRPYRQPDPQPVIVSGTDAVIGHAEGLMPYAGVEDFYGTQPFHLVIFGEKSSLEPVLGPLAEAYEADLYLMTGEISDTYLHRMALSAAGDGRPMIVFIITDCDPAGWQMGISIARKLQAFDLLVPDMPGFQVRRVALTPDQVREHGLPESPVKETEKRAGRWRALMGTEQTEIDALAALRPDLLREIVIAALDPFFDHTLAQRARQARQDWTDEALAAIKEQLGEDGMTRLRDAAEELAGLQEDIERLNEELQLEPDEFELPDIEIPESDIDSRVLGKPGQLLDSRSDFAEQSRRLKESKAYGDGGEDE